MFNGWCSIIVRLYNQFPFAILKFFKWIIFSIPTIYEFKLQNNKLFRRINLSYYYTNIGLKYLSVMKNLCNNILKTQNHKTLIQITDEFIKL